MTLNDTRRLICGGSAVFVGTRHADKVLGVFLLLVSLVFASASAAQTGVGSARALGGQSAEMSLHMCVPGGERGADPQGYDRAYWACIKDLESDTEPLLYAEKGILLARGQLEQGFDRCAAVKNFERAADLGAMYVFGFLDALYGGDWTAVAAAEGNRVALYLMANRIFHNRSEARQFLEFNDDLHVRDAAYFYSQSARLGYEPADSALRSLARRHPDLFGPDASADPVPDIEAVEVFCAPRRYE